MDFFTNFRLIIAIISVFVNDGVWCIDTRKSAIYEYHSSTTLSGSKPVEQAGKVVVSPLWLADRKQPDNEFSGFFHVQFDEGTGIDAALIVRPFLIAIGKTNELHFHPKENVQSRNFKRAVYRILSVHSATTLNGTGDNFSNFTCRDVSTTKTDHSDVTEHASNQACRRPLSLTQTDQSSSSPLDTAVLSVNYQQRHRIARNGTFLSGHITEHHKLFLPHSAAANGIFQVETVQSVRCVNVTFNHVGKFAAPSIPTALGNFPGYAVYGVSFEKTDVGTNAKETTTEPFAKLLKKLKKHSIKSSAATVNSGRAFLRLLTSAGAASKEDIVTLLKESLAIKKKDKANLYFILDLLAASQSLPGFEAIEGTLNYKKTGSHLDYFQRYITALAFAKHPKAAIAEKLLSLLEQKDLDKKLEEAAALAVAAMGRTLSSVASSAQDEVVGSINDFLSARLRAAKESEWEVLYLRALGNLASLERLPLIINYVKKGGSSGNAAIRASRRYNLETLEVQSKNTMEDAIWSVYESTDKIFNNNKVAAVDWLISKCSSDNEDNAVHTLVRILLGTTKIRSDESRTYVVARLRNHVTLSKLFRKAVAIAMTYKTDPASYSDLGEIGQSTAYKGLLRQTKYLNGTYDLGMEFAGGSMRETFVKVSVGNGNSTLDVLSFGLYAHGLASFMGGSDDSAGNEDSTVTAGLVLDMADVSLPKIVFFNGLGELTSLAMSASGDDPVAEMQFNLMLQNVAIAVPLGSGMTAVVDLQTTIAAEFSGFVEASLWYRTMKSLVRNRVAVVMQSETTVHDFTGARHGATSLREASQGKVDFMTSIEFSGFPVKLCMQMSSGIIKHSRYQKWNDRQAGTSKIKSHKQTIPAKSYAFGWKNSDTCRNLK